MVVGSPHDARIRVWRVECVSIFFVCWRILSVNPPDGRSGPPFVVAHHWGEPNYSPLGPHGVRGLEN